MCKKNKTGTIAKGSGGSLGGAHYLFTIVPEPRGESLTNGIISQVTGHGQVVGGA